MLVAGRMFTAWLANAFTSATNSSPSDAGDACESARIPFVVCLAHSDPMVQISSVVSEMLDARWHLAKFGRISNGTRTR